MWIVWCKEQLRKDVRMFMIYRSTFWDALKYAMRLNEHCYRKEKDYMRVYYIRKEKKNDY